MKIIIAPDKFKGSLTSFEVCNAIEQGLMRAGIGGDVYNFPLADGGDGFAAVMKHYMEMKTIQCQTVDPLNRPLTGNYQWSEKTKTAVIEMAVASGIALLKLDELDPFKASTYGTGLLVKDAIEKGAERIILGIGGSATNDGGVGILTALGFVFYDGHQQPIHDPAGGQLSQIRSMNKPANLPGIDWDICCDVNNLFFGINGAAYVYGPQKGASEEDVRELDAGLENFAKVLFTTTGNNISEVPGAGAAGGVAGGLMAALNATLLAGIDRVLDASHIHAALDNADLVITGEGKLDHQSLQGKVVGSVADLAGKKNIPCIAFCGRLDLSFKEIQEAGLKAAFTIAPESTSLDESIKNARFFLQDKTANVMKIVI